ncbi:hypothetical protein BDV97DRAFT_343958 [Delphinella strobiligena]|nr:hypothetical protein BDV97DRAFT_343958 [Delphinella strobiligena]
MPGQNDVPPTSSSTASSSLPSHSDAYGSGDGDGNGGGGDGSGASSSSLVNYYFVFIALALLIIFLGLWFIFRKRTRARNARLARQQATLSQDLAANRVGRGWTYGESRTNRHGHGGILAMARRRRAVDEGLDESGEAPPPYKPRDEEEAVPVAVGATEGAETRSAEIQHTDTEGSISIPLRTLDREHVGLKPPDYSEAVAREVDEVGRGPSASSSREERRE